MSTQTFQTEVKTKILPALGKALGKTNVFAIPRLEKVKVSVGIGKIGRKSAGGNVDDAKVEKVKENIAVITGQTPTVNLARKAISNFKLRAGMPVGISVTLRGARMYDFVSRLINVALPRVRDFRGVPAKFDGRGNYSLGIKDLTVFPEIQPEKVEFIHGLEVTFVTTASNDADGKALLEALKVPFRK